MRMAVFRFLRKEPPAFADVDVSLEMGQLGNAIRREQNLLGAILEYTRKKRLTAFEGAMLDSLRNALVGADSEVGLIMKEITIKTGGHRIRVGISGGL